MDKLSRDAFEARLAGVSYGALMAMRSQKPQQVYYIRPGNTKTKNCVLCGEPFQSNRRDRKYCCGECADKARQRQSYQRQKRRRAAEQ